jgi:hypothetical protein
MIPRIAKAIANSPRLERLDISSNKWRIAETILHLHDVFTNITPDSLPLKLRHLGVSGIHLRLDEFTISPLRSLTSFEWVNLMANNNSSAEVWRKFKSEGVQFSRLKTSSINDSLLDFLSSSQGMTDIRLVYVIGENDEDSDRLARIFFKDILPHHSDTLETLHINASDEGYWVSLPHPFSG